jgi:hypothetical protein
LSTAGATGLPGRVAGEASAAVAALISMISPLPYSADFRPYFTIHDEDFGALAGGQLPDNSNALPRLLGVTNLYFLKVGIPYCDIHVLGALGV